MDTQKEKLSFTLENLTATNISDIMSQISKISTFIHEKTMKGETTAEQRAAEITYHAIMREYDILKGHYDKLKDN